MFQIFVEILILIFIGFYILMKFFWSQEKIIAN